MRQADGGVRRAGAVMAAGTLASRATGFLRTTVMFWALGAAGLGNIYNVTNVIPNVLYDLLLGGILGGVLVPLLVEAKRDEDGGLAFARSLLTITAVGLGALTLLAVVFAPEIATLYSFHGEQHALAVTFLRFFLPQIVFYGLSAVSAAILNTRDRYGAPMVAPAITNVITIGVFLVFIALPGGSNPAHLTTAQKVTLGLGTTLGIAAMWIAVLPSMRQVGVTFRPTWALRHPGLTDAWALSRWVLAYVVVNQLGFFVITLFAGRADQFAVYSAGYQILQLPHAIIAVSVITALQPRIAAAAIEGRAFDTGRDVAAGIRTILALLLPATATLVVLGPSLATVAFAHGQTTRAQGQVIGQTVIAFGAGLVAFSVYQLAIRCFYSMKDTKTPFRINLVVTIVNIGVDLAAYALVPRNRVAVAFAVGLSLSYLVGALVSTVLLSRRVGDVRAAYIRRIAARCTLAATVAALAASATCLTLGAAGISGSTFGSLVRIVVGSAVVAVVYVRLAARMRVHEVRSAVAILTRLVRRAA